MSRRYKGSMIAMVFFAFSFLFFVWVSCLLASKASAQTFDGNGNAWWGTQDNTYDRPIITNEDRTPYGEPGKRYWGPQDEPSPA